jgi:hypothetical protein
MHHVVRLHVSQFLARYTLFDSVTKNADVLNTGQVTSIERYHIICVIKALVFSAWQGEFKTSLYSKDSE